MDLKDPKEIRDNAVKKVTKEIVVMMETRMKLEMLRMTLKDIEMNLQYLLV